MESAATVESVAAESVGAAALSAITAGWAGWYTGKVSGAAPW
jgi:hypothetical protein